MFRALLLLLIAAPSAANAAPSVVAASGVWVAFDRGSYCEATARSVVPVTGKREQPRIALSFDRAGRRHGQLSVRLRRPARPGSSVVLTIGGQPFLLVARGMDAWSKGPAQEAAVIAAMRANSGMRVEARDAAGRRMIDRYLLDGAPTAIDAAAAACAR